MPRTQKNVIINSRPYTRKGCDKNDTGLADDCIYGKIYFRKNHRVCYRDYDPANLDYIMFWYVIHNTFVKRDNAKRHCIKVIASW